MVPTITYCSARSMTSSRYIIFAVRSSKGIRSSLDRNGGSATHATGAPADIVLVLNNEPGEPGGVSWRAHAQNLGAVRIMDKRSWIWAVRMPCMRVGIESSIFVTPRTFRETAPVNSKMRFRSSLDGSSNLGVGSCFRRRVASSRLKVSSFSTSGSLLWMYESCKHVGGFHAYLSATSLDSKRLRYRIRFIEPSRRLWGSAMDFQGSWWAKNMSSRKRTSSHASFCLSSVGSGCLTQNQPFCNRFSSFRTTAAHLSPVADSMRSGLVRTPRAWELDIQLAGVD